MTPKERKDNFLEAMRSVGADQGLRCSPHHGRLVDGDISDNALVMAGAIGISLLVGLRHLSYSKVIGPNDLQACIDAFFDAAEIDEKRSAMGAIVYERKERVEA